MSRYTGPKHRLCRRVGQPLCGLPNCPSLRRPYPPGQHGRTVRRRLSQYGKQLLEKQKLRFLYGITERQLRRYFQRASRVAGRTGERLVQLLESRLDNVVYRLGFARTLAAARQLVVHGHVQVNGRKVDRPGYPVRPGDEVAIRPKSRELEPVRLGLEMGRTPPAYLEVDPEQRKGRLVRVPRRDEVPVPVDEGLVVEYYAR